MGNGSEACALAISKLVSSLYFFTGIRSFGGVPSDFVRLRSVPNAAMPPNTIIKAIMLIIHTDSTIIPCMEFSPRLALRSSARPALSPDDGNNDLTDHICTYYDQERVKEQFPEKHPFTSP